MKHLVIVFLFIAMNYRVLAQDTSSTYRIELLKVAHLDKRNPRAIGAMFLVTPLDEDTAHFPPVISMGISYAVNGDSILQRVDIQSDHLHRIQLEIFDKDIETKAPHLYARIKHLVAPETLARSLLLFFRMRNISEVPVHEVELVYGLWEKDDLDVRVERQYKAVVE